MGKSDFFNKKKSKLKDKAHTEMIRLLELSKESYPAKESVTYAKQAFTFSSRHKITIPRDIKHSFCKKCYIPLFPGINARVRISSGKLPKRVITCENCGNIKRVVFKKS